MPSLYKQASIADEVMVEMAKALKTNKTEQPTQKLAEAVDHLNSAASIFDKAGYANEADAITSVIERLAGHQDLFLEPHERAFYDALPAHHKERLGKLDLKAFKDAIKDMAGKGDVAVELDPNDVVQEFEPGDEIEMESVLPRGQQLPNTDRLDEIITFKSLPKSAGKKKAL